VFKNVIVYRMLAPWTTTQAQLEEALQAARFVPCGASQEKAVGWIEPRGEEHGALVEVVAGHWLLRQMIEVRVVPGSVVRRKVDEKLKEIEATTGRKPGRKQVRDLREDTRMALLPLAFTKQATQSVWIDPRAGLLILEAGTQARADEVVSALVQAIDGLALQLLDTATSPAAAMAHWLSSQEAPQGFSIDRECELKAADESKAVVRYARHALDIEEVRAHVAAGKMPTRLAMTWRDRVSFVLTEGLQLKKLAFLDVVLEDAPASPTGDTRDSGFDTDAAIATGELSGLIPDLLEALGGETPKA